MKAVHAIYDRGKVQFTFDYPDIEGPTPVLVIFPPQDIWEPKEEPTDGAPIQPLRALPEWEEMPM